MARSTVSPQRSGKFRIGPDAGGDHHHAAFERCAVFERKSRHPLRLRGCGGILVEMNFDAQALPCWFS